MIQDQDGHNQDGFSSASGIGPREMMKRLRAVMASAEPAQIRLDGVVRTLAQAMRAEVCSIYVRGRGNLLELSATEGLNQSAVHRTRLRMGEGLVGDIAAKARPLALADAQSHEKFAYLPETGEEIYQSLAGVPILRAEAVLGVLVVQNRVGRQYAGEEIETLETVAMVLAEMLSGPEFEGVRGEGQDADAPVRLAGETVAGGLVVGRAQLHRADLVLRRIVAEDPADERRRLDEGLEELRRTLDTLFEAADVAGEGEHRDVLETFRMIADDTGWARRMRDAIETGLTAEAAVQRSRADMRARMSRATDPYLRERLSDFEDLTARLVRILSGEDAETGLDDPSAGAASAEEDIVIIARSMGPAELLSYDRSRLRGLVLEEASAAAHVAIVARALDIPVVGRVDGILAEARPGDPIVLDGDNAQVFLRPGDEVRESFGRAMDARSAQRRIFETLRDQPAVTLDGERVRLMMNAGLLVDLPQLDTSGAEGIGLYRTEIPFMARREYPTVEQQTALYGRIYDGIGDRPVVFRTLDAGGDKPIRAFEDQGEENPALGWRALRIVLDHPSLLRQQIRAMILAARGRPLSVLLPMVTEVDELQRARDIIDLEIARARRTPVDLPSEIKVGAMIEVPSMLWQIPNAAPLVDFFSVGTNDLLQFAFAADRGSLKVSGRYATMSTPFLRMMRDIARNCAEAARPVTVCGEMAGRPVEAMALIGLGFRSLSMNASSIGPVKRAILGCRADALADLMEDLCRFHRKDATAILKAFARDHLVTT